MNARPNPLGVFWIPTPQTMPQPYLRQIAGGATWAEAVWCAVEPRPGEWDWTALDRRVRQARELGFTLLLKIRVGACWATEQGPSHQPGVAGVNPSRMPMNIPGYANFVRAIVSRYAPQGVREYAVENEPDAANYFWSGSVDQLVTLTQVAAKAIRTADPKARVVSWGISSEAYGVGVVSRLLGEHKIREAIAAYRSYFAHRKRRPVGQPSAYGYPAVRSASDLRGFLAGPQQRRALACLHAEQRLLADHVFDVRQLHFYETWQSVPALLSYVHATTPQGVPIEVWEAGQYWHDGGPSNGRERADQVTKTVVLLLAGGVSRVVWLPLTADPRFVGAGKGKELQYGLLAPGGRPREAVDAFRQLVQWSTGKKPGMPVGLSGGQGEGVAFPHGPETWLVIWSDHGGATVPRPQGTACAWEVSGRAVTWPPTGLRVGPDPLFVKVDTSALSAVATVR